jgi:hypothetical protein
MFSHFNPHMQFLSPSLLLWHPHWWQTSSCHPCTNMSLVCHPGALVPTLKSVHWTPSPFSGCSILCSTPSFTNPSLLSHLVFYAVCHIHTAQILLRFTVDCSPLTLEPIASLQRP